MNKITVIFVLLIASCSSAFNSQSLNCALQTTVSDAAQLNTIITACQQISVTDNAIPNCIIAAAASKWTQDEITCFIQIKTAAVLASPQKATVDANVP